MFVQEDNTDGKRCAREVVPDASTDALPKSLGVRIEDERATVVGDYAEIPNRRAAHSDDEIEQSGDIMSLEDAQCSSAKKNWIVCSLTRCFAVNPVVSTGCATTLNGF